MFQVIKRFILRQYYKLIGMTPAAMPQVQYWKTKESVQAKVTKSNDGSIVMVMEGEDEPFPTFPRGHLMISTKEAIAPLSKLKHEIKNQIFNESWAKLEAGVPYEEIIADIKSKLFGSITEIAELSKYDMLPPESMCPSTREIYRAFTVVAGRDERILKLRDYLTFILQEDDAYRNRVQWMVKYFNPGWFSNPGKLFLKALQMIEYAEVTGDMKSRIKLLRRVLEVCLKDERISAYFNAFCKEVNWHKVALSKADAYHFRGKYFKADMDVLEY